MDQLMNNFESFFFVFIRAIAIFALVPFLGSRTVPMQIKIVMALLIGFIITPTLSAPVRIPDTIIGLVASLIREALVGVAIGLAVRLVFAAFEMAGQFIGVQMGFGVALVFDPQTSSQLSVMAQFYNLMGILLMFSLNLHHVFITAIRESFDIVPPYGFAITDGLSNGFLMMAGDMFRLSIKLSAPVMAALLLANLAMGILTKTAPQFNLFSVGFPVTIFIGLAVLIFTLPFIFSVMTDSFADLSRNITGLLKAGNSVVRYQ